MMQRRLSDKKSRVMYNILNWINNIAIGNHFENVTIQGAQNLPTQGSFILISNHTSRWDGPVVQKVLGRPGNYMVSPNELKGLQGMLLPGLGAFPAHPKFDLVPFMRQQAIKGEAIVIFPEGNVFPDETTHAFKKGAARIALQCAADGLEVPIVPIAIKYSRTKPDSVTVLIGEPISVNEYLKSYRQEPNATISNLTQSLHREVCHLRVRLGCVKEREVLFAERPNHQWIMRPDIDSLAS